MKVKQTLFKFIFTLMLAIGAGSVAVPPLVAQIHSAAAETVYIVQRGDTLGAIARRYGTAVAVVKQASLFLTPTNYARREHDKRSPNV